jgi:hypothetical protein
MRNNILKFTLIVAIIAIAGSTFVPSNNTLAATSVDYVAPLNTTTVFVFQHTGNLAVNEPCAGSAGPAGDSSYHVQPFYVDADGAYTMHINLNYEDDTVAFLYSGDFNPADFTQNCQIFTDDGGSISNEEINANLVANTQYYLVTSLCCGANYSATTGTYDIDNRIQGAGNVLLGSIPTPGAAPASAVEIAPDARLNWRVGDNEAVLYRGFDADGDPTMQAYYGPTT